MYYLKGTLFIFVYEIVMSTISVAILTISTTWISIALAIVCVLFFLFLVGFFLHHEGQKALKVRNENDLKRQRIVQTGQAIDIDAKGEYQSWKGFIISALMFIPMFLLLFIYAIILICGGADSTITGINSFVYMLFAAPIMPLVETFQGAICFSILYGAVITSVVGGISYIFGARKIQRQYDLIKEKTKFLHGDK